MKALAHAAGLSVAGLYHYFGSKRDLALYPLSKEFCTSTAFPATAQHVVPAGRLASIEMWIEVAFDQRSEILLAADLARQLDDRAAIQRHTAIFQAHESWLIDAAGTAGLEAPHATAFARSLIAVLVGENATLIPTTSQELRLEVETLVHAYFPPKTARTQPRAQQHHARPYAT